MDINQIKMNNLIGKDQDIDASSMVSADDNSEVFQFWIVLEIILFLPRGESFVISNDD